MTGNQLRALKVDDPKRWRTKVIKAYCELSPLQAAESLDVSLSTFYRWLKIANRMVTG